MSSRYNAQRLLFLLGAAFVAEGASLCAGAEDTTFALEPTVKATAFSSGVLLPGTSLSFSANGLKPNETLLLQKCGEPCNTAKLIRSWRHDEMALDTPKLVVISEPGRYYFWIIRNLPNGEVGPVFGESSESSASTTTIRYVSGTTVSVAVSK